jgi:hypothetical protein
MAVKVVQGDWQLTAVSVRSEVPAVQVAVRVQFTSMREGLSVVSGARVFHFFNQMQQGMCSLSEALEGLEEVALRVEPRALR